MGISDFLYLPSIYDDLFVQDNTFKGWNVNPAPNFFPDMPLFFMLNWLFGNFQDATIGFSVIQMGLTSLACLFILKHISTSYWQNAIWVNISLILLHFIFFWDHNSIFGFQLLTNGFHYSAFLNSLFCAGYVFAFLRTHNKWFLLALLIHCLAAVVSDKLALVTIVAPLGVLSLFCFIKSWKNASLILLTLLTGGFSGIKLFNFLRDGSYIQIPLPHRYLAFDNVINSWKMLVEHISSWIAPNQVLFWILLCGLATLITSLFYVIKWALNRFKRGELSSEVLFAAYLILAMIIIFVAPVLSGSYTGWDTIRYNVFTYMLGVMFFPFILSWIVPKSNFRTFINTKTIGFIAPVMVLLMVTTAKYSGYAYYKNYYPERVATLDTIAKNEGLKFGIAPYNDAKVITMYSKTGLRVYAVFEPLGPWLHVTNPNWFYKNPSNWTDTLVYGFVLSGSEVSKQKALTTLGPIRKSIPTNYFEVLITQPFYYPEGTYEPVIYQKQP